MVTSPMIPMVKLHVCDLVFNVVLVNQSWQFLKKPIEHFCYCFFISSKAQKKKKKKKKNTKYGLSAAPSVVYIKIYFDGPPYIYHNAYSKSPCN